MAIRFPAGGMTYDVSTSVAFALPLPENISSIILPKATQTARGLGDEDEGVLDSLADEAEPHNSEDNSTSVTTGAQ